MELPTCARKGCDSTFERRTHNQKYCSDECCRLATNDKMLIRYYEKKERKSGKPRKCLSSSCEQMLSRYNEGDYCASCITKQEVSDRLEIKRMLGIVCPS